RSIVLLAKDRYGLHGRAVGPQSGGRVSSHPDLSLSAPDGMRFIPFTAQTRISGVDLDGLRIRKGAPDAMTALILKWGKTIPADLKPAVGAIARNGGTPLVVARNGQALGVVHLKDI